MAKIITAYLSDLMQQHLQGAISFSRMVELLNEKAQEQPGVKVDQPKEQPERRSAVAYVDLYSPDIDEPAFPETYYAKSTVVQMLQEYAREGVPMISDEEIFTEADNYAKLASQQQDVGLEENISMDFARGAKWATDRMNQTNKEK